MPALEKQARVFISSTFRDMAIEWAQDMLRDRRDTRSSGHRTVG
jgi:hypothetical protein